MSEQSEHKRGTTLAVVALAIGLVGSGLGAAGLIKLNTLAEDDALTQSLSQRMSRDQGVVQTIAGSPEIAETTQRRLEAALQDETIVDELVARTLASDALNQLVEVKGAAAVAEFKDSAEFRQMILAARADGETDEDPIAEMRQSLARYERELAALAREVKDDESAAAVNNLQGQLVALQRDIAGLSDRVDCAVAYRGNSPRTFLLKSNESTALPGMDLVVSLSRYRNEVIETVSVSAREGSLNQVRTQVIGGVELGRPFSIAQGDAHYEGTFTFVQTRLFGKAFIGFEIRPTAADVEPCGPTMPAKDAGDVISAAS
jgi:hypothetical protein